MVKSSNQVRQIVVIAHNIRSTHNIGSLFRTCEGLGVHKLILSGYTPYPIANHDVRLPHIAQKVSNQIDKTALGAVDSLKWLHTDNLARVVSNLKTNGYEIIGLEQTDTSLDITETSFKQKVALILGNEVEGIDQHTLGYCDRLVEIPMVGTKESFNVVQAAAMSLFYLSLIA